MEAGTGGTDRKDPERTRKPKTRSENRERHRIDRDKRELINSLKRSCWFALIPKLGLSGESKPQRSKRVEEERAGNKIRRSWKPKWRRF